jgi:hypothetical protein
MVILEIGSNFFVQASLYSPIFQFPAIVRVTDLENDAQLFSVEIGSQDLFAQGWSGIVILLNSASQGARITGVGTSA